jgi:predicted transcriptional regulator
MGNRSRTEIVSQVLEAANGGATKTKIMYRALLSYKQMKEYVKLLTEKGMLVYDPARSSFKTTEKGYRFLQIYDHLDQILKEQLT